MYSIVFRGVPHPSFYNNLKEIRHWYNDEVILSTWDNVTIDYQTQDLLDKVVTSNDPGENTNINNPSLRYATRQILAARNGIMAVDSNIILLSRTDVRHPKSRFSLVVPNNNVSKYKVFSGKLTIGSIMSIDPDSNVDPKRERLFRMCDWFQYGYKKDLIQFTNVIQEVENNKHTGCCLEQLWFLSCFNKFNDQFKIDINHIEQYQDVCWKIIVENFNIINSQGLNTSKWHDKINESIYISEEKYKEHLNA